MSRASNGRRVIQDFEERAYDLFLHKLSLHEQREYEDLDYDFEEDFPPDEGNVECASNDEDDWDPEFEDDDDDDEEEDAPESGPKYYWNRGAA